MKPVFNFPASISPELKEIKHLFCTYGVVNCMLATNKKLVYTPERKLQFYATEGRRKAVVFRPRA